jgi:hypothetical protein
MIGGNRLRYNTIVFVSSCFWLLDCRISGLTIDYRMDVYSQYASIENKQAGFYQPGCCYLEFLLQKPHLQPSRCGCGWVEGLVRRKDHAGKRYLTLSARLPDMFVIDSIRTTARIIVQSSSCNLRIDLKVKSREMLGRDQSKRTIAMKESTYNLATINPTPSA